MILVVGGAFQGKLGYAKEAFGLEDADFADGAVCGFDDVFEKKGINRLHEYVRRSLKEGRNVQGLAKELARRNPRAVIICNELGSGVVPADGFDREWREASGRLSCDIAREAEQVHRVVCGIGTVIKGG